MYKNLWKINNKSVAKDKKDWLLDVLAKNRGLTTPSKLKDFLNPTLDQITNIKLSDLDKGTKRIITAIKNKEKIVVYSDYDADGITAAAILWETLFDLGALVMPYVPHRIKEGYGLFVPAIEKMAKEGVNLIITVDQGVTATKQVDAANKLGIDVVITDHHVLPQKPPKAFALVHTTELCGAGVAWRLCWEIISKYKPDYQKKLLEKLELAAIATIADLVPLNGACRSIVKFGLLELSKTKRPGLKSLMRDSKVTGDVGTYEIGHILAPRINAMGRIEHGLDSLRLICAKNQKQADSLASLLAKTNSKRQDLTSGAVTSAFELIDTEQLVGVVSSNKWHEGVIGLVASRLVEAHHKPMIVISRGETFSKGSARSIPGFNIVEAIRNSSEFLVDAGGHPMAAGFTIESRHIESFTKKINVFAQTVITEEQLIPVINIECQLDPADINVENFKIIKQLEPYGMANPEPVFLTKRMVIEDLRTVGNNNQHIKLQVNGLSAIGFNKGDFYPSMRPGYLLDLVYTIAEDKYNGNGALQLKIKDLKLSNN
jgi:single-stranded-DNA-specific exonuclease